MPGCPDSECLAYSTFDARSGKAHSGCRKSDCQMFRCFVCDAAFVHGHYKACERCSKDLKCIHCSRQIEDGVRLPGKAVVCLSCLEVQRSKMTTKNTRLMVRAQTNPRVGFKNLKLEPDIWDCAKCSKKFQTYSFNRLCSSCRTRCLNCGHPVQLDSDTYCTGCLSKIQDSVCTKCNTELEQFEEVNEYGWCEQCCSRPHEQTAEEDKRKECPKCSNLAYITPMGICEDCYNSHGDPSNEGFGRHWSEQEIEYPDDVLGDDYLRGRGKTRQDIVDNYNSGLSKMRSNFNL